MHAGRYLTLCVTVLISTFLISATSNFHMNFNLKRNLRVLSGGTKINQVTRNGEWLVMMLLALVNRNFFRPLDKLLE